MWRYLASGTAASAVLASGGFNGWCSSTGSMGTGSVPRSFGSSGSSGNCRNETYIKFCSEDINKTITFHLVNLRSEQKDLLMKTIEDSCDIEDEEIQVIHVFDTPLYPWMQLLKGNVKHCFVVFKSSNWYWSLEKNSSEFVVQRFARIKDVKDKIGGADRLYRVSLRGIDETIKDRAKSGITVKELFEWIWEEELFLEPYDLGTSNCQHFAEKVFNFVAKNKKLVMQH